MPVGELADPAAVEMGEAAAAGTGGSEVDADVVQVRRRRTSVRSSIRPSRRLVATGSGDKPQLRCLVVRYARVRFLHLHGSPDTLASRIGARTDHFMPSLAADVPNGNF